jgi:hypothetical protein
LVNHRKFLFKLRLWTRLVIAKRKLRRVQSSVALIKKEHEKELSSTRSHYEILLANERLKSETLALAIADRTLEAFKLMNVSHAVSNLGEQAQKRVDPAYQPPEPNPEDYLGEDEHDLFLDLRDGFFEAERSNGRSEAEIARLWNEKFKRLAIQQAKDSIIQ